MSELLAATSDRPILVTDFDGTLTDRDFYRLVMERLVPPSTPDYWSLFRQAALTHFDAIRLTFLAAEGGEPALEGLAREMGLCPTLAGDVAALRDAGWGVLVVSGGCTWYIDRLLADAGVALDVIASPGAIEEGKLVMSRPPEDYPYPSEETGVDKAAVVKAALEGGRAVAFAGDGIPDLAPALLVPADRRFARAGTDLARELTNRGEKFRSFTTWSEVARALIGPPPG